MAFTFELSKVDMVEIRRRMLGHLDVIDPELGTKSQSGGDASRSGRQSGASPLRQI